MQLFFRVAPHCKYCVTESPQYGQSTSAGTPGSLAQIPAESALIITASPSNWRQRATAGGEELGFKQYRLQEVQPSLLVVNSDINSNEYLGVLPDCLSMNCDCTRGWALEAVLFVCVCATVPMSLGLWVTNLHFVHGPCTKVCPFIGADMSNIQRNGRLNRNN